MPAVLGTPYITERVPVSIGNQIGYMTPAELIAAYPQQSVTPENNASFMLNGVLVQMRAGIAALASPEMLRAMELADAAEPDAVIDNPNLVYQLAYQYPHNSQNFLLMRGWI